MKTLVNVQIVLAAPTRYGRLTSAVWPSGGDEKAFFHWRRGCKEKQLGFVLVQFQSGAGFLYDLIKDYIHCNITEEIARRNQRRHLSVTANNAKSEDRDGNRRAP